MRPVRDPRRPARAARRLPRSPGSQVLLLARQAPAGRGGHGLQRIAEARGHRRRHGALHERRLGQQDRRASLLVQQVDGQFRGEDGAPEVHEDQHAVRGPHLLDRAQHLGRVRPERSFRLVQPAGGADAHVRTRHLRGQLGHALREPGAVADDDEADHGYAAPASANAAAAASSSSHDEVAPGSWWPALRSPR